MVPLQKVLTKADCKKSVNGYVRMDVYEFTKMQAFGWNDKNPVHILSTADSSEERGAAKLQIPCPRTIPMYNGGMK
jgi:hypothetical protein